MLAILKKPILWLVLLPAAAALVWLLGLPNQPAAQPTLTDVPAYIRRLGANRAKKDSLLRHTADSPVQNKASFAGLPYFQPDPAYRVMARLEPFPEGQTPKMVVTLTDGTTEVYEKVGHAVFSLANTPCRLLVLRYQKTLTVLFQDETSGRQTYGGGRYLDLDPAAQTGNELLLDFNEAYNPYCAYSPGYACPLPPPENKLSVAIRAGERYEPTH